MVIQELFSGKEGGDMKTGDILPVLRDGELHRVSAAAVGGGKTKKKIYKGIFHKAVPAYPKDGYAYIYRGLSSFQPAFKMKNPSRFMEFVFFLMGHDVFANAMINVFTDNPHDGSIGIIVNFMDKQQVSDTIQAILEYEKTNQPKFYLILVTTNFRSNKNVAIYIDNPHNLPLPFFELDVRIVPLEEDTYKQDIAMQSPRFILQNGNVFCTEVPTINRIETTELSNYVYGSKRTNIYLRKRRKHGGELINHFDNKGGYIKIGKFNARNPVRLNCGETDSFRRIKETEVHSYIINRGRGIHTIETTVRQLHNSMGGVIK